MMSLFDYLCLIVLLSDVLALGLLFIAALMA